MVSSSIRIAALIMVMAFSLNTTVAQDAEPLALITGVNGRVLVAKVPDLTFVAARWGLQLFEGDRIRTLEEAEVAIHFSNDNLIILGPNSSMTIATERQALGSVAIPEKRVDREVLSNLTNLAFHRSGPGQIALLAGLRSAGTDRWIEPDSPRNTIIRGQRPVFSWKTGAKFEQFEVKLFDETGQIWKGVTTNSHLEYPDDAVLLEPDKDYFWQVEGEQRLEMFASRAVNFQILTEHASSVIEEREESIAGLFRNELDESRYLMILGAFYEGEGLLVDAIDAFNKLAELHPEASLPHDILAVLYADIGLNRDAIKATKRADELKMVQ